MARLAWRYCSDREQLDTYICAALAFEAYYSMTALPISSRPGMCLSVPCDGFEPFAELFGIPTGVADSTKAYFSPCPQMAMMVRSMPSLLAMRSDQAVRDRLAGKDASANLPDCPAG